VLFGAYFCYSFIVIDIFNHQETSNLAQEIEPRRAVQWLLDPPSSCGFGKQIDIFEARQARFGSEKMDPSEMFGSNLT
jgi:hypothetical protein